MLWKEVSFLLRSSLSRKILDCLNSSQHPLTVLEIAKKTDIARSNVSTKLCELRKRKLVVCINPKDKKFRFYKLTRKGRVVLKQLNKYEKLNKRGQ